MELRQRDNSNEKTKTAEEFARELKANSEYQARLWEREKQIAANQAIYAPEDAALTAELREHGVAVSSVYDLVNTSAPYPELYSVLVRHLDIPHHRVIREGIIRALTIKDAGVAVESALLKHFQSERDSYLQWVLANALKTVMPYHKRKKYPDIARTFKRQV
ncbi:MAG TPA: hypothetical protein VHG71_05385 [Verrucomicrobiae bacterium]|nr:hypothetical protein [Verrucomicrobiae bacterium]